MSVLTGAELLAVGAGAYELGQSPGQVQQTGTPNIQPTAQDTLASEQATAPGQLQLAQQYGPQYQDLLNNLTSQGLLGSSSSLGALQLQQQAAPQIQQLQSQLNNQQAGSNIGLVQQYGSAATQAFQNANPQLQAVQSGLTNLATSGANPVQQYSAPNWSGDFSYNAGNQEANLGANIQQQTGQLQSQIGGQIGDFNQAVGGSVNNFSNSVGSQTGSFGSQVGQQTGLFGGQVGQQIGNFQNQVGQSIGGLNLGINSTIGQNQVGGAGSTVGQLNNIAQQQLALGTSVSPQQAATLSGQILANYNQQGRANDPTAIAGLATGLDTYGQQLLSQREQAAGAAGALQQGAQQSNQAAALSGLGLQSSNVNSGLGLQGNALTSGLGLQGSALTSGLGLQGSALSTGLGLQGNALTSGLGLQGSALTSGLGLQNSSLNTGLGLQGAALTSGLGLQGSALQAGGGQQLQTNAGNQAAQLSNAQYQLGALGSAGNLLTNTSVNPFAAILGQSGAIGVGSGLSSQSGAASTSANAQNQFNPYNISAGLYNTQLNANSQANLTTANNNQANQLASLNALFGGYSLMCWVAREVFGQDNPKWTEFRAWMLNRSPRWFRWLYVRYGAGFAIWIHDKPRLKAVIRRWMEGRIANYQEA